jgi:exosortase/archaeosortase family protein
MRAHGSEDTLGEPHLSFPWRCQQFLRQTVVAYGVPIRICLLVAAVVGAYQYSLLTVLSEVPQNTPLAYLGLVPPIAALLAAVQWWLPRREPPIHDRTVDFVVGLPLLSAALSVQLIAPIRMSSFFWFWRVDLLTMPFFLAGAVAILFGVRAMWRMRAAILFVLLAWPPPYLLVINRVLAVSTNATTSVLDRATLSLPVAHPVASADGSVFSITHAGHPFTLSIGSACGGADGVLGFLITALAFACVIRGAPPAKLLWVGVGAALTWAANVGRILLLFWMGQRMGETAALSGLHPLAGLVTFGVAVLIMIAAMPLFRLRWPERPVTARPRAARPGGLRSPGIGTPTASLAGTIVVLVTAALLADSDRSLQDGHMVAQDLGAPSVQEVTRQNAFVAGWSINQTDSFPWAGEYFGSGTTWDRYEYQPDPGGPGGHALTYHSPVVMDVVTTSDLNSFSVYPVDTCYAYRGAQILQGRIVSLGGGVIGHVLSMRAKDGTGWSSLYWQWPVASGPAVRYERVVLLTSTVGSSGLPEPAPPLSGHGLSPAQSIGVLVSNGLGDSQGGSVSPAMAASQRFLVAFGHDVVQSDARSALVARRFQPPVADLEG